MKTGHNQINMRAGMRAYTHKQTHAHIHIIGYTYTKHLPKLRSANYTVYELAL